MLRGLVTTGGLSGLTGLTVLGVGGCTSPPEPSPGRPAGRAGVPPDARSTASEDPDTALVALLAAEISRAHARVRANRLAHPELAPVLRRLERLHARHAAELGGLTEVNPLAAEPRRGRVVPRIAAAETRLQRRLVADAVAAESGALALLVATMAAGLAQEQVLL